jgi:hypothetical protein
MAVVCTDLLANQARLLADMIETLPCSLEPLDQHQRCCDLLARLELALSAFPQRGFRSADPRPGRG